MADESSYGPQDVYRIFRFPELKSVIEGSTGLFLVDVVDGEIHGIIVDKINGKVTLSNVNDMLPKGFKKPKEAGKVIALVQKSAKKAQASEEEKKDDLPNQQD